MKTSITFSCLTVVGIILILMVIPALMQPVTVEKEITGQNSSKRFTILYITHTPITIDGDADFIAQAAASEWPGNGSTSSPYIIDGLNITGYPGSNLIEISNTEVFFRISNCLLSGGEMGINLLNVTNGMLAKNTVTGNENGIIAKESSKCMITSNNVTNNILYGIRLSSSSIDNVLCSNTVTNNGFSTSTLGYQGILISGSSRNCTITNNTVTGNGGTGIEILHSYNCTLAGNTVINNSVKKNDYNGISAVDSNNCTYVNNFVVYNKGNGIIIDGTGNSTLTGNVVIGNLYHGVKLLYSGNNTVKGNEFFDNNQQGTSQGYDGGETGMENDITGNYWSDWSSPDNDTDGTVDIPYPLDGGVNNTDPYPLVKPVIDTDRDGMTDIWEYSMGLDPGNDGDATGDLDSDDLSNLQEYNFGSRANQSDTESDGMDDLYEYLMGLNPVVNDSSLDKDGDGLTNLQEYNFGSWANQTDTENDGMDDLYEYLNGLNATQNDRLLDRDGDIMPNYFEYQHGLLAGDASDAVGDKDRDGIPNLYEYWNGLQIDRDDATGDPDGDGMTNLYEYLMGLDPRVDDGVLDKDGDDMSNIWEFTHGFDAGDPSDAATDADGDWVSNVNEYRGGSDPRDAASVPLLSFSTSHAAVAVLLLIAGLVVLTAVAARKKLHQSLVTRLKAPDYVTALVVQKSGFKDYPAYAMALKNAEEHLEEGNKALSRDDPDTAIQQYGIALSLYERLGDDHMIAEMVFITVSIQKKKGIMIIDSPFLHRFPFHSLDDTVIETFHFMLNALQEGKEVFYDSDK